MDKKTLLKLIRLWPPYLGAGIKVIQIAPDLTSIQVEMKLRFWNKNYFGTHFGGSLYSMTDPFFALILIEHLGEDYEIWDKAATIHFKKPGRGKVFANFKISLDEVERIRTHVDEEGKAEPIYKVKIYDEAENVVAEVEKKLYVRRKNKKPPSVLE